MVIGAGAAGIAASGKLSLAGREVLVLEARDRIGGRIWTVGSRAWGQAVELGAEFVHGGMAARNLSALTGVATDPWSWGTGRQQHSFFQGKRYSAFPYSRNPTIDEWIASQQNDESFAASIDRETAWSPKRVAHHTAFVTGTLAAAPEEVSMLALRKQWEAWSARGDDGSDHHIRGGYNKILRALSSSAKIKLKSAVSSVDARSGPVKVRTVDGSEYAAKCVVVTLPLGALKRRSITFKGVTMKRKWDAVDALGVGSVVKTILRFDRRWWDHDFRLAQSDDLVQEWWPLRETKTSALLVGWSGGPMARALASGGNVRKDTLLRLDRVFPRSNRPEPTKMKTVDWSAERFTWGCYSHVPPGALGARDELALPVGRVFFAGEATHTGAYPATVWGAVESGRRAADEVLMSI